MKVLGMLLIVCAAIYLPYISQQGRARRLHQLSDFARLFSLLRGELQTHAWPLPALFETLEPRVGEMPRQLLNRLLDGMERLGSEEFSALWEESVSAVLPEVSGFQRQLLSQLGQTLGRYDLTQQCEILKLCEDSFLEAAERETRSLSEAKRLVWGLALSASAMLIIILL